MIQPVQILLPLLYMTITFNMLIRENNLDCLFERDMICGLKSKIRIWNCRTFLRVEETKNSWFRTCIVNRRQSNLEVQFSNVTATTNLIISSNFTSNSEANLVSISMHIHLIFHGSFHIVKKRDQRELHTRKSVY